jgi:antitoxin component of MazEF toxin-antitoxin module
MLKKLVRYGNSNALVLDKAILELLNIAEGSVVKISTDGKSIILTPFQPAVQTVIETLTSTDAMHLVGIRGSIPYYKDFDPETQKILEKELSDIMKHHSEMIMKLNLNPEFQAESLALQTACGTDSIKFAEMRKSLLEKYNPELAEHPKKIAEFDKKCRLLAGKEPIQDIEQQQKDMGKEFQDVFAKHKYTQMACSTMMQSPEYVHRAQLLTERFQDNQGSVEFIEAMKKLMYEFCPEMEQIHKDLDVIAKKYNQNFWNS